MQEAHNGSTEKVELAVYLNGQLDNADGSVLVTIYDADDSANTVLSSGSAVNEPPLGLYTFQLDPTVTNLDRVLKIVWSYTLNSVPTSITSYVGVVTPYASVSDILDYYGFGTKQSDSNYKSEREISAMERIARTIIDNSVNNFYSFYTRFRIIKSTFLLIRLLIR